MPDQATAHHAPPVGDAPDADEFEKREDVDEATLLEVLGEAVQAIENAGISYLFIGGLASILLGSPNRTNDIDFFVRPEDAEGLLEVLERRGFATRVKDPSRLMKALKRGVLVDVIFRSTGFIYLDDEILHRRRTDRQRRRDANRR